MPNGTDSSAVTPPVDIAAIQRRHRDYEQSWTTEPRPSATMMAIAACSSANDVPVLLAENERLRRQHRRAQSAATELLRRELNRAGHGRDGHLNEDDIAVIYEALESDPTAAFDVRSAGA
jgi:hypothetical protein